MCKYDRDNFKLAAGVIYAHTTLSNYAYTGRIRSVREVI